MSELRFKVGDFIKETEPHAEPLLKAEILAVEVAKDKYIVRYGKDGAKRSLHFNVVHKFFELDVERKNRAAAKKALGL